ncbi:MAG: hypothetical protein KC496_12865, partial [Anaerolineae bacterium]|nr:hypothetical protein [Anaerolineae bacterium]
MSETAPVTPTKRPLNRIVILTLLLAIVLVGGFLRFMSLNWDDFAGLHPDERFLTRNLLPLIGGTLEYTPDEQGYPSHLLIVPSDATMQGSLDALNLPGLQIGVLDHTLAEDLAGWWANPNRVTAYDNSTAALEGLLSGDVTLLLVSQQDATPYLGVSSTRV